MLRGHRRQARNHGPQDQLAELAYLYECGRYAEAIALGGSMLEGPCTKDLRPRIQLQLAMANLQLGRPHLAREPLAAATKQFQAGVDAEAVAECAAAQASLALLEQRPDALELAKEALSVCRALREVPHALELRILNGLATAHWLFGQRDEAIDTFEEAIGRIDPVVDMRRLGKLLDSAASAYSELGQYEKADGYRRRAVALFETLNDLVSLARAENGLGWSLMRGGDLSSARRHLERSLQLFEQTGLMASRSGILCSLCELYVAERNLEQAAAYADAAIELAELQGEAWSIAEARIWRGRVAARLGDHAAADSHFQCAMAVLRDAGMADRLVECHATYAEELEERGDLARAYEQLKAAFCIAAGRQTA